MSNTKGDPNTKAPIYKKWWFWAIIVVVIVGIGEAGVSNRDNNQPEEITNENTTNETSEDTVDQGSAILKQEPAKTPTDNATQEQKNALKKAKSYAKNMHMSKQGIFDQLTSEYGEGFAEADAQYAIDNLEGIDWNTNALAKAKTYYNSMNMSKSAVFEQLISDYGEQFTQAEAQYAIDHLDD